MGITISIPSSFADGILDAEGTPGPRQIGFACVVGIAWIRGGAGANAAATWSDAERREAQAVDAGPQVYCVRRGAGQDAKELAPCSDLGCAGCERGA